MLVWQGKRRRGQGRGACARKGAVEGGAIPEDKVKRPLK